MTTVRVSRSVYRLSKCGGSRYPCLSLFPRLRPMSSDAIAKLPSPLKDLVTVSVTHSSVNAESKPEVDEWIEKVANGQVGKAESLKVSRSCLLGAFYVPPTSLNGSGPQCSTDTPNLYRGQRPDSGRHRRIRCSPSNHRASWRSITTV